MNPSLSLTLYGGHHLAGRQSEEPAARTEALAECGGQRHRHRQQPRHRQVQDEQVPGVPVSSPTSTN